MKGIEFVCLGNNARSVMAEVVAKDYARKISADIPIYSSGVYVKSFREIGPEPYILNTLAAAGITGTTPQELVQNTLRREAKIRNEVLELRGYNPATSHIHQQTDSKKDIDLFLVVADKEKGILLMQADNERKFLNNSNLPRILTIAEYTNNSYQEMKDVGLQDWFTKVEPMTSYLDGLIKVMPHLIDKYMCEFNK